jgi:hypothetical protein
MLAGCGGGGNSGSPPPPAYAVNAALGHLLGSGGAWTVSGTASDGHAYVLTYAFAPQAPAPFPVSGATAARSQQTMSTKVDGIDMGSAAETFYFDASSLQFVGIEFDNGSCSVMKGNTSLPTATTIGTSGPLFNESDNGDCVSGSPEVGTTAGTWSLESDSNVVLLCWNLVSPSPPESPTATASYCFEIQTDGTLGTKARLNLAVLGGGGPLSLVARNF